MRLNLGSGTNPLPGYVNLDIKQDQQAYPLNLADGSCDEVRASHLLEHFSHQKTLDVLTEWVRVLKPGGILKIAVPDFSKILDRVLLEPMKHPIEGWLMGGQQHENDFHYAIFTENKLAGLLQLAGCENVSAWESDADDCSSFDISLNLQGVKSVCVTQGVERMSSGESVSADGQGCWRDTCSTGVCP